MDRRNKKQSLLLTRLACPAECSYTKCSTLTTTLGQAASLISKASLQSFKILISTERGGAHIQGVLSVESVCVCGDTAAFERDRPNK